MIEDDYKYMTTEIENLTQRLNNHYHYFYQWMCEIEERLKQNEVNREFTLPQCNYEDEGGHDRET